MRIKKIILAQITCCLLCVVLHAQQTFANPILPAGADPWSIYKNGYYYYTHTFGDRLGIWKTKSIADLRSAPTRSFLCRLQVHNIPNNYGHLNFIL